MISVYVRQSHQVLRRWVMDPKIQKAARWAAHILAGFCLSAAGIAGGALPLGAGLVWTCRGLPGILTALGSALGYWHFWGKAGLQGLVWVGAALVGALLLADRPIRREVPLLIPSLGMLWVSAAGLGFQLLAEDTTSVGLYLLRVALGGAGPWLFGEAERKNNSVAGWLTWGCFALGLAQIAPVPWLGLGFVAVGAMSAGSTFICAAVVGLALDIAGITPIPMTAVAVLSYLVRFLPNGPRTLRILAPGLVGILMMRLWGTWNGNILPGLFLGGLVGNFLPSPGQQVHRRGETGVAQVQLELAAGVLNQTRLLLQDVPESAIDTDALVRRAAESACAGCAMGRSCRDARRIATLPGVLLQKPLLSPEELPIRCRKPGRFLAELHRSQEKLRAIQADRERQREYREAVNQQYRFLGKYLQDLSDRLSQRAEPVRQRYSPSVRVYGNCAEQANGDRCVHFSGVGDKYYIILCDGMGTGPGAVQEGRTAVNLLQKMITAGFPPEHALGSLNSLCALRQRAGAVTVDLAEISLDTGKTAIYKWGAPPSYLVGHSGMQKLGSRSFPPGISVTEQRETVCRCNLRPDQMLLLASDGISQEQILESTSRDQNGEDLGYRLLESARRIGEDDATLVTIRLLPVK